jgi:NifU-like protein involved in Fe-S cluster formation
MRLTIKVKDDKIEDVKFRTFGCGAAIATVQWSRNWLRPDSRRSDESL